MKKTTNSQKVPNVDFDTNWKFLIETHFLDFVAFFLPTLFESVDFSMPPEFLDQELRNILRPVRKGKKITDKLVKVYLKDGSEKWILVHLEVQHEAETHFNERMFVYFFFIFFKYQKETTALAIFTNDRLPPDVTHGQSSFKRSTFGTTIFYEYNAYWVGAQTEEMLLSSNNIFALAVLANRCVLKTRSEMRQRLEFKKKLFELAADKFYPDEKVLSLLVFLEELLTLPLAIQAEFEQFYNQIFNKKFEDMPTTQFRPKGLLKLELNREYGMTLDELDAQLKKAKIAEQLEQNLEVKEKVIEDKEKVIEDKEKVIEDKEKVIEDKEMELHRVIIKLHNVQKMTAEQIADFLERPLDHIIQVLQSAKV